MYSSDDEIYEAVSESPQKEWITFLYTIKAECLLDREEKMQKLWIHLRNNEPELLDTFEIFLDNAVKEIERVKEDKNIALKSKRHKEREIQDIFVEVEKIVEEERARVKKECEIKHLRELQTKMKSKQYELQDVMDAKEQLEDELSVMSLNERQRSESIMDLNNRLSEISEKENELRTNNDLLKRENKRLQIQLSNSIDNLALTHELCLQLHEKSEKERHRVLKLEETPKANEDKNSRQEINDMQTENQAKCTEIQCTNESHGSHCIYRSVPEGPVFAIMLIGDANVGKTSLMERFCFNTFTAKRSPTLDISFVMKTISTTHGLASLQIWDTAGQERFRSVPRSYLRKADGIMLLYDVGNETSLTNSRHWITSIEQSSKNDVTVMLVGNKIDQKRRVSQRKGEKVAQQQNALYTEVCAKTGENVQQAFQELSRSLIENSVQELKSSESQVALHSCDDEKTIANRFQSCCGMIF